MLVLWDESMGKRAISFETLIVHAVNDEPWPIDHSVHAMKIDVETTHIADVPGHDLVVE